MLRVSQLASIVHAAATAYIVAHDGNQPDWNSLHHEHRAEAMRRARFHLDNPDAAVGALFEQERQQKLDANPTMEANELPRFEQMPDGWRWLAKLEKWICVGMRDYVDKDAQDPEPAQGALLLGNPQSGRTPTPDVEAKEGKQEPAAPSPAQEPQPGAAEPGSEPAKTDAPPPAAEPRSELGAEQAAKERGGGKRAAKGG